MIVHNLNTKDIMLITKLTYKELFSLWTSVKITKKFCDANIYYYNFMVGFRIKERKKHRANKSSTMKMCEYESI